MKIEDLKQKLSELTAEGADIGSLTDSILSDYSDRLAEIEAIKDKDAQISDLVAKNASLNDTNLKLVNKIKYQESLEPEDNVPKVTLSNLFD